MSCCVSVKIRQYQRALSLAEQYESNAVVLEVMLRDEFGMDVDGLKERWLKTAEDNAVRRAVAIRARRRS